MLLTHDKFKSFTPKTICDATKSTEVLVCLVGVRAGENVDDMVRHAVDAGKPLTISRKTTALCTGTISGSRLDTSGN